MQCLNLKGAVFEKSVFIWDREDGQDLKRLYDMVSDFVHKRGLEMDEEI